MRRFFAAVIAVCLAAPAAMATGGAWDVIFAALDALNPDKLSQEVRFEETGDLMSATVSQTGMLAPGRTGTQWHGLAFLSASGERLAWDDLFIDGDAAAARMEAIAGAATYDNAYAEHKQVAPIPRDRFAVNGSAVTVYYPWEQFSFLSGHSGGFSFLAYELDGLLQEGLPPYAGDTTQAGAALDAALADGALPGFLAEWNLGRPMREAADALRLVDVPDYRGDYAVWEFEAPQMRGVSLLSDRENDRTATAAIAGIFARRIDFSGLQTGVSTLDACLAALGEPMARGENPDDPYMLEPAGTFIEYQGGQTAFRLSFADGVLYSIRLYDMAAAVDGP